MLCTLRSLMYGERRPGAKEPVVTQKQMDDAKALIAKFLAPDDKK